MATPTQPPSATVLAGYPVPPPIDAPPGSAPPGSDPRTNGFAITSLVLGIAGPCLSILLGIVFGIVALRQIKRYGQRGRGLAIAGLSLSGVWAGAVAVGVPLILVASGTDRDDSGQLTEAGQVSVEDLAAGDCITDLRHGESVSEVSAVPCTEPHASEVFAVFELSGEAWPGEDSVLEQSQAGCSDHLAAYSAEALDDPSVYITYFSPSSISWAMGDREIICMTYYMDGRRTGSLRG